MPIGRLLFDESASDGWNRPITAGPMATSVRIPLRDSDSATTVLWSITSFLCAVFIQNLFICSKSSSTRTPPHTSPHIKHKQKAVFPIQFSSHLKLAQDPELPLSPIDWSYTPHLLEARWMTAVVSAVSAYRVSLPRQSRRRRLRPDEVPRCQLRIHARRRAHPPLYVIVSRTSTASPSRSRSPSSPRLAFVTYSETSKQFDGAILLATPAPTNDVPPTHPLCHRRRAQRPCAPLAHLPRTAPWGRAVCGRSGAGGGGVGEGAEWVWEEKAKGKKEKEGGEKEKQNEEEHAHEPDVPPFALHDIMLSIPCGTLAAVVGRVGSGKSGLLQGLIRMRTTNTGGKDNMLFGRPFEVDRYWHVIEDSCLLADLQLLADGRCGQRQRVNIARTLYYGADVVIFDDPLSAVSDRGWQPAVDANVGKTLFRSAIQGLVAQGKTVILVTHAPHFLAQCNYIYTVDGGASRRQGRTPSSLRVGRVCSARSRVRGAKGGGCGGEWRRRRGAGAGGIGRGRIFGKDIDSMDVFHTMLCPCPCECDLTEDPAIVAKRTELAQRMNMLEGVRKDPMAFEK
ncbi:P-loop containing nucleoside triphosphate hydrolase protein [Mycena leptocephala]|nr:P-loop containing nucleoside triphosphate hydrolase protein [Mycena leptocephala]